MPLNDIYTRLPEENERQYIWRVCGAKDAGLIDKSWTEVAEIINRGLGKPEDEYLCESAYRKAYQIARDYNEDVFSKREPNYSKQIQEQRDLLYQQKRQLMDQRREYNKEMAVAARAEHLHEVIQLCASNLPALTIPEYRSELCGDREAVLFLTDWHYGMTTDNVWNTFNSEVAVARIAETVQATKEAMCRHEVCRLHVVLLGDMVAGAIHVGSRVEAEETVCEQLMHVSELIAQTVSELASFVPDVIVYSTYGNHSRTVQNCKESTHRDNMERIIPWWLTERLQNTSVVVVPEEEASYGELIHVPVCGYNIIATHGDLDKPNSAGVTLSALFQRKLGISVDYVVLGHLHRSQSIGSLGIDTYVVPSLCGSDAYAHSKRLYSLPGQTLMIFSPSKGRECIYTIRFTD